jgi:pectinesterase
MMITSFAVVKINAQSAASAAWPLSNPTAGGTGFDATTSGLIKALPEYLKNMEVNQYTGPNSSQRLRIVGNLWPTWQTKQLDTVYFQFIASPAPGNKLTVTSVSLSIGAASTSYMKANIYYSKDSTFATSTAVDYSTGNNKNYFTSGASTQINITLNQEVNDGESFYFRIYPWVDSSSSVSGKYICPQNVVVSGFTSALASPASANWLLASTQSAITSGLVTAKDQSFSSLLKHYSYTYLGSGTGNPNCSRMLPPGDGIWPADSVPNMQRYVQYVVAPKPGGTLYVNSVSFGIGAQYSTNIKAAAYYAHDSLFTNAKLLMPDTLIGASDLFSKAYGISDTVQSGQSFYLRIYPYDTKVESYAKLICVGNVLISGATTGAGASLPELTTTKASYISTTFATSGGTVTSDGGASVTERGVCWNTAGSPVITDSKTSNGAGSGQFKSSITGLTAGAKYYVRAYATNTAGTAYGVQDTIATLAAKVVPTVTTSSVTSVMTTTANSGGNVTAWGGDTVTARGVCWNTTGSPTVNDSKTANGSDIGQFTSVLSSLLPNKQYYVRAYAVNSIGAGYGNEVTFTTQTPAANVTKVVDLNGTGDYKTVQAAFDAIPDYYTGSYTIFVKRGTYKEKITLAATKTNVILVGEDRDSTVLTYDDYNGRVVNGTTLGTSTCQTVAIDGADFTAYNITFQNTSTAAQAVALRVNGDRGQYYNCNLLGYQDTYYGWGGSGTVRTYHKNCKITGSVDFIFGRNIMVFDSCEIHVNRNTGTLTAANTDSTSKFGIVFNKCKITTDSIGFDGNVISYFYLGRPWQYSPRTVFLNCEEPANLQSDGWQAWNVPPKLYAEYKCSGPGYKPSSRVSWSVQLTDAEASAYSLTNMFAKTAITPNYGYDWMPAGSPPVIPVELSSFSAAANKDIVILKWSTATETNNYGFYLERSDNGGKFTSVGFINGKGTTAEKTNYSFTDKNVPAGESVYRLKQVDLDGTYKYTGQVTVNITSPKEFSLDQNYPNPFNPATTIKYSVPADAKVTLSVYNLIGEKVAVLVNQVVKAGNHEVAFNASKLSSGVYFYKMEGGSFTSVKKMVLIK